MNAVTIKLKNGNSLYGLIATESSPIDGFIAMKLSNDKEAHKTTYVRKDAIATMNIHDVDFVDVCPLFLNGR